MRIFTFLLANLLRHGCAAKKIAPRNADIILEKQQKIDKRYFKNLKFRAEKKLNCSPLTEDEL